jgi:hypothetical protein
MMNKDEKQKPGPRGIKRTMKTFRFPDDIARKLRIAAERKTVSEADYVQLALRVAFNKDGIE